MGKISCGGSQETGVFVKRSNPRVFEYWRENPSVNTKQFKNGGIVELQGRDM